MPQRDTIKPRLYPLGESVLLNAILYRKKEVKAERTAVEEDRSCIG